MMHEVTSAVLFRSIHVVECVCASSIGDVECSGRGSGCDLHWVFQCMMCMCIESGSNRSVHSLIPIRRK